MCHRSVREGTVINNNSNDDNSILAHPTTLAHDERANLAAFQLEPNTKKEIHTKIHTVLYSVRI